LYRQLRERGTPASLRHAQLIASLSASLLGYAVAGAFLSAAYYPHMYILGGLLVSGRRVARAALQDAQPGLAAVPAPTYHPAMKGIVPVPRRA
jgi:hypothetical protein